MPTNPTVMKVMSVTHLFWYRLTGGVIGGSFGGRPILLLSTTGRKSGRPRTTPLQYLERNSDAEVRVRNEKRRVKAGKAEGEERGRLWQLLVEMYSGYEGYQKTANREIPVVVLRPQG